jgi:hypothetical protein
LLRTIALLLHLIESLSAQNATQACAALPACSYFVQEELAQAYERSIIVLEQQEECRHAKSNYSCSGKLSREGDEG